MNKKERRYGRLLEYSVLFVMVIVVAGIGLYYALHVLMIFPVTASTAILLVAVIVLGFLLITLLGRELKKVSSKILGNRHGSIVYEVYRFISYVVLAFILLAIVGVSGTELLAGGTFAGLILGLASQTVLSNYIAGLMVIFARPFEVDDRVTIFTWQYGAIAPAYPPRFYSNDILMPGYSGVVKEIGLAYTNIELDEGPTMKIPTMS